MIGGGLAVFLCVCARVCVCLFCFVFRLLMICLDISIFRCYNYLDSGHKSKHLWSWQSAFLSERAENTSCAVRDPVEHRGDILE